LHIPGNNRSTFFSIRSSSFLKLKKTSPTLSRDERKSYIKAKYEEKKFVETYCSSAQEIYSEIEQSIATHNLYDLLQAFAEAGMHGVDLTDPLPSSVRLHSFLKVAPAGDRTRVLFWFLFSSLFHQPQPLPIQ
jgi:hypothetical protein